MINLSPNGPPYIVLMNYNVDTFRQYYNGTII